jgi:two-component system sensor histidine kinase/response regulator
VEKHTMAAMRKKITLAVDGRDGPVMATADHQRLTQVIDNLVTNALKFSPEGRAVTLRAESHGNSRVSFQVKDQGPGFTAEDKAKMFLRYCRLSAHPTAGEPSTGLGLSIVKRLVDGMHGDIELSSETGKGSCFTVRLPAPESSAQLEKAEDGNPDDDF